MANILQLKLFLTPVPNQKRDMHKLMGASSGPRASGSGTFRVETSTCDPRPVPLRLMGPFLPVYFLGLLSFPFTAGASCVAPPFQSRRCISASSFSLFLPSHSWLRLSSPAPHRNRARSFFCSHKTLISKRAANIMEISSLEGSIPAATNNDEEEHAMLKSDRTGDEPEVAHANILFAQPPSATTATPLHLRRSSSPIADRRIPQWKKEKRSFKGTFTYPRVKSDLDSAGPAAAEAARAAQKSPLMVNGKPQFAIFCDGSSVYKLGSRRLKQEGGYAVVFRDPYDADKAATARASNAACTTMKSREEDSIKIEDFTIRHWLSDRTFGSGHCEMAALAQALEEVAKRIDQHQPQASMVKIFTDFEGNLGRIEKGILTTEADGLKRKRPLLKIDTSFYAKITNPFVQVIVWLSHYLSDRGCKIEMIWMPRNTTLGHKVADHMSYKWKTAKPGSGFNQRHLPHSQRDGIMDKLHEQVGPIERARVYTPRDRHVLLWRMGKLKLAVTAKEWSPRQVIADLNSPSDYIALDSEEEELEPQPQRPSKRRKTEVDATRAKKTSTTDSILPHSNPEESKSQAKPSKEPQPQPQLLMNHEPLPQPPKEQQKKEGGSTAKPRSTENYIPLNSESDNDEPVTQSQAQPKRAKKRIRMSKSRHDKTAKERSTVDFILLDSDSSDPEDNQPHPVGTKPAEPKPKPQAPKKKKKKKKTRGAIPTKKKNALLKQTAPAAASGFLKGKDHDFTFETGSLPAYPEQQQHASHGPESGNGNPSCLLCQYGQDGDDDECPWRSGYTGLPSQWALRRY